MITPAYAPTATERVLPRLALDFTTGVLDSRVTVTRALNTATRVNSSGYIEGVNADLPRFDYDPITLAPKGLLIEETRQNIAAYSDQFDNAYWTKANSSIDPNVAISPSNAQDADKLIENTASTQHGIVIASASRPTIAAGLHTASFFVKAAGRDYIALYNNGTSGGAGVSFNLINGTVTATTGAQYSSSSITAFQNGWYRVSLTFNSLGGTSGPTIYMNQGVAGGAGGEIYTGDGVSGIYIWGAQLEAGAFATSYIPTTTTSLTRNADVVSMTGTNFSSWFNASEGTISCNVTLTSTPTTAAAFPRVLTIGGANPDTDEISIYTRTQGVGGDFGIPFGQITTAGVTQANLNGISSPINNWGAAIAYKANDCAAAGSGTLLGTDNSVTLPACTQLLIMGQARFQPQPSGWVRKINYWPQRLTNAEVQAFSKQG